MFQQGQWIKGILSIMNNNFFATIVTSVLMHITVLPNSDLVLYIKLSIRNFSYNCTYAFALLIYKLKLQNSS